MSSPLEIYLGRLCPLILDFIESPKLISSFSASFEQSNVKEVIQQFETDSTCSSLFVEYIQDLTLEENPKAKESSSFTFNLEPVPAAGRRVVSLSLVKCDALPIHSNSSVASQVRVIKLHNNLATSIVAGTKESKAEEEEGTSTGSSTSTTTTSTTTNPTSRSEQSGPTHGLQALYDFVHHTFAPLVRSVAGDKDDSESSGTSTGSGSTSSQALPLVAKSLKEFEYALKNCMQHTEIPEINFQLEPEIVQSVVVINEAAAAEETKSRPTLEELGFGSLDDDDSNMLSRLANSVKRWTVDVQKITKLDRDINSGAAVQEVNFWRDMEVALEKVDEQFQSTGVELTLEILNREKQFYVTMPFRQDTGLEQAKKKVEGYMQLLRDFPINSILTSPDILQMTNAVLSVFNHLRRMKSSQYPVERGFRLLEAISRDLAHQIMDILASWRMMKLPYDSFVEITDRCDSLFRMWDEQSSHFRELARDIAKKRGEHRGALPTRLSLDHRALQERIEDVRDFRKNHEKLREVIERVLPTRSGGSSSGGGGETKDSGGVGNKQESSSTSSGDSSGDSINDVASAYQHVVGVDVLDVGKEGSVHWESAKRNYEIRIDRVESQITEKLTDLLATAKTGDEKFRVFSKFNALFFRHRIRGAIQQHQAELIATVKEDIQQLQNMFKRSYTRSEAERMSTVRDLPPMSGKIIWAKQIERQLTMYMNRIEAVLGKDWERHTEGRSLKAICDSFRRKLDTQPIFDEWMARINIARTNNPNFEVNGNVFSIEKKKKGEDGSGTNGGGGESLSSNAASSLISRSSSSSSSSSSKESGATDLVLKVSFDPDIIMLFKEVRNLHWLNQSNHDRNHFRVPYTLKIISDEAKEKYPYAMALNETLRTYQTTLSKVDSSLRPLVAGLHRSVQSKIHGAFKNHIRWDSEGLEMYVKELSEQIYSLQDRVGDLLEKAKELNMHVDELATCNYDNRGFSKSCALLCCGCVLRLCVAVVLLLLLISQFVELYTLIFFFFFLFFFFFF